MSEILNEYSIYGYLLMYMYLFLIGCVCGFFIEVLFRRYVSVKKWVNPGFLKGPWIPLYGFGVVIMSIITTGFISIFNSHGIVLYNPNDMYEVGCAKGPCVYDLIPILIMGVGMTLLELVAGLIFVLGFKVRLWDYTNDRGNFKGIICPKFSIIWIVVSFLFYYGLSPFIYRFALESINTMLSPTHNGKLPNIILILLLGNIYGMMIIDFITSIGLFTKVSQSAKKLGEVFKYELVKRDLSLVKKEASTQIKDMMPETLRERFNKYSEKDPKTTLRYRVRSFLYIDPEPKKNENFDSSGRPISQEEYDKIHKKNENSDGNV